VKDDHNEVAMYGQKQKPSIWTIVGIFAAAAVLVVLLLWTPRSGTLSLLRNPGWGLVPGFRKSSSGLRGSTRFDHSTFVAPGIMRNALVRAQLVASVNAKPINTLMIAGRSTLKSQYWIHSANA
jgi:hypothetical protein